MSEDAKTTEENSGAKDRKTDASPVQSEAATPSKIERANGAYVYTKAEDTLKPSKRTETNITVQRTVDRTDGEHPIVVTTVKEENKSKRKESDKTTVNIDEYGVVGGFRAKTEEFENVSTYDRKGRIREGVSRHFQGTEVSNNGALNIGAGETTSYSFSNEHIRKNEYHKDGTLKSSYEHSQSTGSYPSVCDETVTYRKYTDFERAEVKENMRVAASAKGAEIRAIRGNRDFLGEISSNGSEHYSLTDKKKVREIWVDTNGKVSGIKARLDEGEENLAEKKELSSRELKGTLKKMRREADNAVKAASGMKRVEDYLSQVPQASGGTLTFPWNVDQNAMEGAKPEVKTAQQKWINENTSVDAEMILAQVKNSKTGGR